MQIIEVSIAGVRSAMVRMARSSTPLEFLLCPMVHVGSPGFYREVTERLRRCDLIVAEGRDEGSSTGLAYVIAGRITRQRGATGLVHQNIDFDAVRVPVLWPDVDRHPNRQVRGRTRIRGLEWLTVWLLAGFQIPAMTIGGRRSLLRKFKDIDDTTRPRLRFLSRLLIDDRDRTLVEELGRIHAARQSEPIRVAIVYGAGHLPAAANGLAGLGYKPVAAEWVTVVDFAQDSAEASEWHLDG